MAIEGKRKQLGRGLSALLGEDNAAPLDSEQHRLTRIVPIEHVHPGRFQPRVKMDEERLEELAHSIRDKGILQPLLVRRLPDEPNGFEIIAGERRWRAAQRAHLHEVPVIIKELSDREALEIGLVENLQRQDLSPLEEADGYRRLMEEFSHSQQELADVIGKSRSHVANTIRLLSLPAPIKEMVGEGKLSAGHARALLNAPNPLQLAEKVVKQDLNVRQTEKLVQAGTGRVVRRAREAAGKDADTLALERELTARLGLKVDIRHFGGGGSLTIAYDTLEQLDDVLRRLSTGSTPAEEGEAEIIPQAIDEDPLESWEAEMASRAEAASPDAVEAALDAFDVAARDFDAPPSIEAQEAPEGNGQQGSEMDDSFDLEDDGGGKPAETAPVAENPASEPKAPAQPPRPPSSQGLHRELDE
jgi:ParB family chromosome partitioning protein